MLDKNFLALLYLGTRQRNFAAANSARNKSVRGGTRPLGDIRLDVPAHIEGRTRTPRAQRTRNLITTLLAHGARATRSAQPRARIAISVFTPEGKKAVRIKMSQ